MIKIGIPRALLYYQYFPMWQTFFKELGTEVVVSPPTTKGMLSEGSGRVVADTCLPVKVFLGHTLTLVDKCDYVFIPAIRSLRKDIYNCSKFLGLPDMTKAVIPECPPVLEMDIDINQGKGKVNQAFQRLGKTLTRNLFKVRQARIAAEETDNRYRTMMVNDGLTPPEAILNLSRQNPTTQTISPVSAQEQAQETVSPIPTQKATSGQKITIALIGHPYLVYDEYITHRLIHRLQQAGCRVLTPEMLTGQQLESAVNKLAGRAYWTYEEEVVGAGGHYLQSDVDGIIGIMTFACGPDSLMMDMVNRQANKLKKASFMSLTLEEHTAEAGLVTRLEAFTDMVSRRKRSRLALCV